MTEPNHIAIDVSIVDSSKVWLVTVVLNSLVTNAVFLGPAVYLEENMQAMQ